MVGDCYSYKLEYESAEQYYSAQCLAVNLGNGEIDSFEWNTEVDVVKIDRIEIEAE